MTSIDIISSKISYARKQLSLLGRHRKVTQEELLKDDDLRAAIERYLYLGIQSAIDAGEALIALRNMRKADSFAEVFEILCEQSVITSDLREKAIKMVGFRNILSHAPLDFSQRPRGCFQQKIDLKSERYPSDID